MNKKNILWLLFLLVIFTSLGGCGKDKVLQEREDENKKTEDPNTPATEVKPYIFRKDGVSTVSIGESQEVIREFKSFNNGVNAKTVSNLSFYKKKLEEKLIPHLATFSSSTDREKIKKILSDFMEDLNNASQSETSKRKAIPGQAGTIPVSNNEERLVNAKGEELGQVLQKALMGALQVDKIYFYLDKALKADHTQPVGNEKYSESEHSWDIAYGYLGRNDIDKERGEALFLANYIEKEAVGMKGLENINIDIYASFYRGRKAITDGKMSDAKKEVNYIREKIANLFYLRTVYYLKESNQLLNKSGSRPNEQYFHSMAEALGFITALPFIRKSNTDDSYISIDESQALYNALTAGDEGLWEKERLIGAGDKSIRTVIGVINQKFESLKNE